MQEKKSDTDFIDVTATSCLPSDGPKNVHAIWTDGDGNCFGRSLSKGYCGDDSMHIEIHVGTLIGGILNNEHYLSEEHLKIGAMLVQTDKTLIIIIIYFSVQNTCIVCSIFYLHLPCLSIRAFFT